MSSREADPRPGPEPGDQVEVMRGPLAGVSGTVHSRKRNRITLIVHLIKQTAFVEIDLADIAVARTRLQIAREQVRAAIEPVNAELIYRISREPTLLHELSGRRFEELIAHLLEKAGYEVQLTPPTRDGGRDILAVLKLAGGNILTVVECKRFARHRRIGPDIVHRLLWVADRHDNASHAMLTTTSSFTRGARELERKYQWRLSLKDYDSIATWLKRYGDWTPNPKGSLWLPRME